MPDWLADTAGRISGLGAGLAIAKTMANTPDSQRSDSNPITDSLSPLISTAITYDPSQIVTKPIMAGLHSLGIGQQGDQWDKGLIGIAGEGFDKIQRLLTFGALAGLPGQDGVDQQSFNARAWSMAFAGQNAPSFGDVFQQGYLKYGNNAGISGASIVTDPQGIAKMKSAINNTWYGSTVSGSLDFAMTAALDPTKGLAKGLEAARAAKYVTPGAADRLSGVLNDTMDKPYADAADQAAELRRQANATEDETQAQSLRDQADQVEKNVQAPTFPSGFGAKASNFLHAATPNLDLNDASVVGTQLASKAKLDNVTNTQQILNELTPRLGMGGTAPRAGLPVVAEMYADAAKSTTDIALQRQIKLNIDYALSGSQESMKWLADNYPTIAAKGMRASGAPAEFSLLEDAMDGYAAAHNIGNPYGRVMGAAGPTAGAGAFDVADYVKNYAADPARAAELQAYAQAVQKFDRFRTMAEQSGPDGAALSFGTSGAQGGLGTQVAPRALESLKTALSNKVADEYLYADGVAGLNVRVINSLNTSVSPNGYVNLVDPITGGQQLANHMKQFQKADPSLEGDTIRQTVDAFNRLDQQGREQLVKTVNSGMMSRVAAKYGISGDDLAQLLREHESAITSGRQTASDAAMTAAANGDQFTALGDLSGTPTFMRTAYLQNHLDTTAPLMDFKSADTAVRLWRDSHTPGGQSFGDALTQSAKNLGALGLKGVAAYHSAWKVAMLGRAGLLFRAQLDTGLRGAMTLGSATMAQEALRGTNNFLNAHGGLGIGDAETQAISYQARQLADGMGDVMDNLQHQSDQSAAQIATRQAQIDRANELADTFKSRQRVNGQFTPTTKLYQQKEQEARDLATRLSGNATTVGGTQPLGLNALNAGRDALEPIRQKAIAQLRDAQQAYLTPQALTKQLTSTPVTHSHDGVMFTGAPVMTDLEAATLQHDLRDSANTMSDLMMGRIDRGLFKQRADLSNWASNVTPDDIQWADKYVYAAHDLEGSYTAHRMLVEKMDDLPGSPEAYLRSYLNDPQVQQEFRTIRGGGSSDDFQSWLNAVQKNVSSLAPNEDFRQMLASGKSFDIHDVISKAPTQAERFPIYGPAILNEMKTTNIINTMLEKAFKVTLDQPDIYLARVPYYVPLYNRNVQALLPEYVQAAKDAGTLVERDGGGYELPVKDALDLHTRAKQMALNDVHRDMYDVSKTLGVTAALRYIAPFAAPWMQAQQSWARLIYDNPRVWGKLMRYSQTPDMFHLTVNSQTGAPVRPWDGTPAAEKDLMVPLHGLGGLRDFGINMAGVNVIIQGNTPFSPGFGPMVQIPVEAVVSHVLPNVMGGKMYDYLMAHPENPVNQLFFPRPGDVPKSDLKSMAGDALAMPTYVKQLTDVVWGANGFGNTYTNAFGTRYNEGIAQWREEHGGKDPGQQDLQTIYRYADRAARAAALARSAVSFGLGLSGSAHPIGQYYVDKMHALVASSAQLHSMGLTPEQVFAREYPDAANLNWSFSENDGNLQATVNATSDYLRYQNAMQAHPLAMWWIAGPSNLVNAADPNGQFSGSAYNTQLNEGLRKKLSPDDLVKQDQIAMGAGRWNSFKQAMRLYMSQNGIDSLHAGNAGDLAGLQQRYEEQLRAQFPAWAAHVDATNIGGGRDQEINQIKDILANPPSADFLQRPDVKATQQYLMARDALIHEAQANNITNWQTAASMEPERAALYAYGYNMASSDLVFHQAWTKLFEGEFYKDILAAKKAAQTPLQGSTTLGVTPAGGL